MWVSWEAKKNIAGRTVREAVENAGEEPFTLLAEELGVAVLRIGTAGLEFLIRYSEDALSICVSQRDVDVPI